MVFLKLMQDVPYFAAARSSWKDQDDIISNLSENLICHILHRLPVEDAVRTSVLSKKWRYKWTNMRELFFQFQFLEKYSKRDPFHCNGFIRIMNSIMINHNGPIVTFVLFIPNIVLDSFQEVDQWMLILSRKNVRSLGLSSLNRTYPLPSSVFFCLELRSFQIRNCIFKPPREFHGFPNVKHIVFRRVSFENNLGGTLINLPNLKYITLKSCVNVKNFNIKAVRLRNLLVDSCPDAMLLKLMQSEHLDVVCICLSKPKEDLQMVERFNLAMMLSRIPYVVSFTIDGYFLKFLAVEKFPNWLPHAVNCLKQLEFQSVDCCDMDQLQGVLCMIRNSPNLKVLRLTHMQMGPDADPELTSNYLESSDCVPRELFKLQSVEITSLEGSRPKLLFVKLLLVHSPHLENMIIRPRATIDARKMLNVAKDILMSPRASTKAKVVYLDP